MEKWIDIPDYEGYYQVSNLGRVRSVTRTVTQGTRTITVRGKARSFSTHRQGYKLISLSVNGEKAMVYVHRLVMLAFVGPCPKGMEVNHIDGDKANNQLSNLEYTTPSDNNQHRFDTLGYEGVKGEASHYAKLTEADVLNIRKLYKARRYTQKRLAAMFGVTKTNIGYIVQRKTWTHV